jgi:hypothetical protein
MSQFSISFHPNNPFLSSSRFRKVIRWRHISPEDLAVDDINIYDSPDNNDRNLIDHLDTLPLLDDNHQEINIYNQDGYRIPRRVPLHNINHEPCGLLADLTRIRSLFRSPAESAYNPNDTDSDNDTDILHNPCTINVYPQAFLRQYGHFQANDVPLGFHPIINSINRSLPTNADDANPVLHGIACQGYNHIQHCLTEQAGKLEVVHGRITTSLSGANATSQKTRRTHDKILESTLFSRPHDRINHKLSKESGLSRAFRVEPIFVVNIQALKQVYRSGAYVIILNSFILSSLNIFIYLL